MSISRGKLVMSMEEVFVAFKHMQQENQYFPKYYTLTRKANISNILKHFERAMN
jgi:hypothetical protein